MPKDTNESLDSVKKMENIARNDDASSTSVEVSKLPKAIIRGFDEESICDADKMTRREKKRRRKRKYDLRTTFDPFEVNVKALEKLQAKYKEEERIKEKEKGELESEDDEQNGKSKETKNKETENKETKNKETKNTETKNTETKNTETKNTETKNTETKSDNNKEEVNQEKIMNEKKNNISNKNLSKNIEDANNMHKRGNKNGNMFSNKPITDIKLDKKELPDSIMDQKPEQHKETETPTEKENTTKDKHILFENDPTFTEEVQIKINEDKQVLYSNDKSLLDFAKSGGDHIKNSENNKTCNVNVVDLSKNEMVNISLLKYNETKKVGEEMVEPKDVCSGVAKRTLAEENRDAIRKFYKGIAIHNYQSTVNIKYIEDDGKDEKKINGFKAFFMRIFGRSSKSH